jgi:hypothetical protein
MVMFDVISCYHALEKLGVGIAHGAKVDVYEQEYGNHETTDDVNQVGQV